MSSPAEARVERLAADVVARLTDEFPHPQRYWIAFSGGIDSSVLLTLLAGARSVLPAPLAVVHVDHGLQDGSAAWAAQCKQVCQSLELSLTSLRVDAAPRRGQSPEAAARDARYAAIGALIAPDDMLLTAHHRDDQAETLLLQLLRGAGVEGLAGMPALRRWRAGWHARPLIDIDRATLRAWAEGEGLSWIDDPSNATTHADRNYLRHEIMPRLESRWPAVTRRLTQSAGLCAEAAQVVRGVAADDLAAARCADGGQLRVDVLRAIGPARARAVLRAWVRAQHAPPLPARRAHEALGQLFAARHAADVSIDWSGVALRRYRDRVWLVAAEIPPPPSGTVAWDDGDALDLGPGLGRVRRVRGDAGIDPDHWQRGRIQIGYRRAGLGCRPAGRDGRRRFKNLVQECAIPPWWRDILPVLFIDGDVAAIANCCACEPFAVPRGQSGWHLRWVPADFKRADRDSHAPATPKDS